MTFAFVTSDLIPIFIILIILAAATFWIWMLIDCATKEVDPNQRIVWVIIISLVGFIGAPLYFFLRKLPRTSRRPRRI